jgi:ribonuclease HI
MKAILHTDGGARGNPGPAGIGVLLVDPEGEVIAEIAQSLGETTNNVAEYKALIAGLELALNHKVSELDVRVDSELVLRQVQGEWKIKNERLRALAVQARSLLNRFQKSSLQHVRRELNAGADRLANQGMDMAELDLAQDAESPQQSELLE